MKGGDKKQTAKRRRKQSKRLTHLDEQGAARMVDVSDKAGALREAVAEARVRMRPETLRMVLAGGAAKGDVLAAARIAGIMAAKRTADLIPLCHPLPVSSVTVELAPDRKTSSIVITATVRVTDRTGVEMEALTAAAVAGLTIYDMCKAVDRGMTMTDVRLLKKTGGRSGTFVRP